jgi:hypothetical protein
MNRIELAKKVVKIANQGLYDKQYVSSIDILLGLGYLSPSTLEDWRRGRFPYLEKRLLVNLNKLSFAMKCFRQWAQTKGLLPRETAYVQKACSRTIHLRFSKSGNETIEKHYRTHYISPILTEQKQQSLIDKIEKSSEPVVYIIVNESKCSQCKKEMPKGSFLMMDADNPYCMACTSYKDFIFLPSGDALLTRRAKKYSSPSAVVVVKFSRTRKRYERQGLLVTEEALQKAQDELEVD